jgi:hypothetical protein
MTAADARSVVFADQVVRSSPLVVRLHLSEA